MSQGPVASFGKSTIPLIRQMMPAMTAAMLVGVQPMMSMLLVPGFGIDEVFNNMSIQDLIERRDRDRLSRPWGRSHEDVRVSPSIVTLDGDVIVKSDAIAEPGVEPHLVIEVTFKTDPTRHFFFNGLTLKWYEAFLHDGTFVVGKKEYKELEVKLLEMCIAHWSTRIDTGEVKT